MASRLLNGRGLVEFRTYRLSPARMAAYVDLCAKTSDVRKRLNPGFMAYLLPEAGCSLSEVFHLYHYESWDERDAVRAAMGADPAWRQFIADGRPSIEHQANAMYVEALECMRAAGAVGDGSARAFSPKNSAKAPVYELREYQLELGYNPIPKLREAFVTGLPSKVAADSEGRGEPAFFGFTDVGNLNRFCEIWRYASCQEAMLAREAGRKSAEWRKAIGAVAPMVQSFSTCFLRPAPFSPWQ